MNAKVICWQFEPSGSGVGAHAGDGWRFCLECSIEVFWSDEHARLARFVKLKRLG
jgi:hypothetical protein